MSFCRSSCIGIWRAAKSAACNLKENHLVSDDENCTNPPMPQDMPLANASAMQTPFQSGLGHMETTGGKDSNQFVYIFNTRWESLDNFFLRN